MGVPHAHPASDGHKVDHLVQHPQSEGIEIHILRLIKLLALTLKMFEFVLVSACATKDFAFTPD